MTTLRAKYIRFLSVYLRLRAQALGFRPKEFPYDYFGGQVYDI